MKIFLNCFAFIAIAMMTSVMSSCNSDDELSNDTMLQSYIVGTWYSYQLVANDNDTERTIDITYDNEWSVAYCEAIFFADGKVLLSSYAKTPDGSSTWKTEKGRYTVNGNMIEVHSKTLPGETTEKAINKIYGMSDRDYDISSDEENIYTMAFVPEQKKIYLKIVGNENGKNFITKLFFRKYFDK